MIVMNARVPKIPPTMAPVFELGFTPAVHAFIMQ
jgi:hypothetical protein